MLDDATQSCTNSASAKIVQTGKIVETKEVKKIFKFERWSRCLSSVIHLTWPFWVKWWRTIGKVFTKNWWTTTSLRIRRICLISLKQSLVPKEKFQIRRYLPMLEKNLCFSVYVDRSLTSHSSMCHEKDGYYGKQNLSYQNFDERFCFDKIFSNITPTMCGACFGHDEI